MMMMMMMMMITDIGLAIQEPSRSSVVYQGNVVDIRYAKIDPLPDLPWGIQVELRTQNQEAILRLAQNATFTQDDQHGQVAWIVPEPTLLPVQLNAMVFSGCVHYRWAWGAGTLSHLSYPPTHPRHPPSFPSSPRPR